METLQQKIEKSQSSIDGLKKKTESLVQQSEKAKEKAEEKQTVLRELELQENTANIKYEQAVSIKEQMEAACHAIIQSGQDMEEQKNKLEEALARIQDQLSTNQKENELARNEMEQASEKIEQANRELAKCV